MSKEETASERENSFWPYLWQLGLQTAPAASVQTCCPAQRQLSQDGRRVGSGPHTEPTALGPTSPLPDHSALKIDQGPYMM